MGHLSTVLTAQTHFHPFSLFCLSSTSMTPVTARQDCHDTGHFGADVCHDHGSFGADVYHDTGHFGADVCHDTGHFGADVCRDKGLFDAGVSTITAHFSPRSLYRAAFDSIQYCTGQSFLFDIPQSTCRVRIFVHSPSWQEAYILLWVFITYCCYTSLISP